MKISVIIPTYERKREVLQALHSLQQQEYSDFEIIVADNAADPELEFLIDEFNKAASRPAIYVREPRTGAHHARHAGARKASGDVLVFTDDDVTFDPVWLQAYADAFIKHPEMAASGGPSRPFWETQPPTWLLEFIRDSSAFGPLSLLEPFDEFQLDERGYFWSLNMAIRTDVLFAVGGFNPDLSENALLGDGETGLCRKLWKRALLIGYVPGAIVYHHIPAQRMTVKYLCHRMANEGACSEYTALHATATNASDLLGRLGVIGCSLARLGLATPARMIIKRDKFALLRARLGLAYDVSRIRYVVRLLRDQRFREMVAKENWLES